MGGYEEIDFEFFPDRTTPEALPGKPAAVIFKGDDALRLDTTDILLFHGNPFDVVGDLEPRTVADIRAGRANGVLKNVFERAPGEGPPDIFVFGDSEGGPTGGKPPGTPGRGPGGQNQSLETMQASDDSGTSSIDLSTLLARPDPGTEAVLA